LSSMGLLNTLLFGSVNEPKKEVGALMPNNVENHISLKHQIR
jgi:hypothetical protein